MNKFQLVVLWSGLIALGVYFYFQHHALNYVFIAIAAAILAAGTAAILLFKHKTNLAHTHINTQPAAPVNNDPSEYTAGPFVEIPGFTKPGKMIFKKDGMEYKGVSIFYKDITSVYYTTIKTYYHGIPVSQTYYFCAAAGKVKISAVLSSAFFIGNKKLLELYTKLIEYSKTFIEPLLAERLVKEIFVKKATVRIGDIDFTQKGYSKKKFFGGFEEVLWSDKVYIPQYAEGNVYVYKDKDDKAAQFKTVSMKKDNAVMLPELISLCYKKFHGEKYPVEDKAGV